MEPYNFGALAGRAAFREGRKLDDCPPGAINSYEAGWRWGFQDEQENARRAGSQPPPGGWGGSPRRG